MTDPKQQSEQPEKAAERFSGNWFSLFSVHEWLAIMGILILVISFFWELGYWDALQISLEEIPMSLESTILAIMPSLVFPVSMALGYGYVGAFMAKDKEDLRNSDMPGWVKKLGIESINGLVVAIIVVYVISILWHAYKHNEIGIGTLWAIAFLFAANVILNVYKSKSAFVLFLLFTLSSYVYIEGWSAAIKDAKNPRHAQLYIADGGVEKKEELIILRSSSDFIFAYNPNKGKVKVVSWREVSFITYESKPDDGVIKIPPFLFFKDEDKK